MRKYLFVTAVIFTLVVLFALGYSRGMMLPHGQGALLCENGAYTTCEDSSSAHDYSHQGALRTFTRNPISAISVLVVMCIAGLRLFKADHLQYRARLKNLREEFLAFAPFCYQQRELAQGLLRPKIY